MDNRAAFRKVKTSWQILADIKEEQLKARIVPLQAKLIIFADLAVNSWQALFKALFFAGHKVADLLQLQSRGILRFPDSSGFLLNHDWTKRSGQESGTSSLSRGW